MALPDIASFDLYGGAKTNAQPVEDYTTDEDAADRNEYVADMAGVTQTICRAFRCWVGSALASPVDPASNVHGAVWGDSLLDKPVVARTAAGVWTCTWAVSITDDLTVVRAVNLRRAWATVDGATPYFVTASITAPNVVTVRAFNQAGVANDAVGANISVFAV